MQSEHPWGRVLGEMAVAGRHDPRTEVADQAASMLLETARHYASTWDAGTWEAAHAYGFAYLLELPFPSSSLPDPSGVPRVVRLPLSGSVRAEGLRLCAESRMSSVGMFQEASSESSAPASSCPLDKTLEFAKTSAVKPAILQCSTFGPAAWEEKHVRVSL